MSSFWPAYKTLLAAVWEPSTQLFYIEAIAKVRVRAAAVQFVGHCMFSYFLQSPCFFVGHADLPGFAEAGSQPSHFVLFDMRNSLLLKM